MPTEKFTFPGHAGDPLAARLDLPQGPAQATAILAHCFTCSKDIPAARRIAGVLASRGIAVLRFDFTGLGHSGGEFANTGFSANVADLVAAARHLRERGLPPQMLIGHSLGGAAVLKAAGEIGGIRAVVTIGAPFDPAHVVANFGASLDEIRERGEAEVCLANRPFTIRRSFLDDVAGAELAPAIANLHAALLVMHSPIDQTVGIDNASQIFLAAKHPKSFVTLDTADHLLSDPADAEYAAGVIAAWAQRYLDLHALRAPEGAPEGVVRVREADPAGFLQDIAAGPRLHALADEPPEFGGTGRGMSPYQLVAAGLGACTSMTLRMYARRKGWPLSHIEVDVTHDKIHAEDCAECETRTGRIDRFQRVIRLEGSLDDAQRKRLLEIADKCPVHRTLSHASVIETRLDGA